MSSHAAPSIYWWVTKTVPQGRLRRSLVPMAPSAEGFGALATPAGLGLLAWPRCLPSSVEMIKSRLITERESSKEAVARGSNTAGGVGCGRLPVVFLSPSAGGEGEGERTYQTSKEDPTGYKRLGRYKTRRGINAQRDVHTAQNMGRP